MQGKDEELWDERSRSRAGIYAIPLLPAEAGCGMALGRLLVAAQAFLARYVPVQSNGAVSQRKKDPEFTVRVRQVDGKFGSEKCSI
jgi:hypothetical protein